ncbi:chitosanase [Streptomyces sp. NBC_00683]|uniref:chitosanase n=1 Tax=Streptomyces sp. NBC_00683 TaxID=2903670 RepID=UPI002E33F1B2|nr:chitosanase [Streptomyces sp. NBC_00683]
MHYPHNGTARRTTRLTRRTRLPRLTRPLGLAAVALGLTLTAIPFTAQAGAPTPSAAHHLEAAATGLDDPAKKDIAMQLVSSAENSSLDWKAQYGYIEDIGDGRGYTAGIIGFCSGTGDMLGLVELYTERKPGNVLAKYLPALRAVDGSDSHEGLDPGFTGDWAEAASDPAFEQAQNDERDRVYFDPAVSQGKSDGLGTLGQFAYYDAIVMHGGGSDSTSFGSIRRMALEQARPPSQGGDEVAYLDAFLDARVWAMKQEEAHSDTSRVDTAQRVFLRNGNLNLDPPLDWHVYGDSFHIG